MSLRPSFAAPRPLPPVFALAAAVLLAVPVAASAASNGVTGARTGRWAHESSSLKPDPNVVWGRLDNGFRYALLPHHGVPGRVSAQLIVLAGSIDEMPKERGIAHFIEHMVFRSTTHFSFEEKLTFFQQLGMEFGSDVNANTGIYRTLYSLDFHDDTPELLYQGLRVLRDFADGAKFLPGEINKERGVVLSEMRDDANLASSNADYTWPIVFKGLTGPTRDPIGTKKTLQSFTPDDFVGFYSRCYRPDLMVLVAAGDFDPEKFTSMVRERFAGMVKPNSPIPPRDEGRLDTSRGLRAGVFPISSVGSATAQVSCVTPLGDKPDSAELRAETLRREVAMDIVADRVHSLTGGQGGSAAYVTQFGQGLALVTAEISPDEWGRELGVLDDLVRFTAQKGFEQREVDAVKRRYASQTSYMLDQAASIDPKVLADDLANSITDETVYTGYAQTQRETAANLATLKLRDLDQSFKNSWDLDRMVFDVAGQVVIEGGAGEVVKKVQDQRRGGLRNFRPDTRKETVFELKKWGTPTEVVESREVPELGATLMRFGNNVRVNFIPNRSEANIVQVIARVGNGLLDLPENQPALKDYGLQTLISSGTANYTPEFVGRVAEDHLAYLSLDLSDQDAFTFRAGVTADHLDIPLGIITDFLAHPLFNTATHHEVKFNAYMQRSMNSFSMDEALRQLNSYLFQGDARLASGGPGDYIGLSTIDVRNWLEEPFRHGYVELTIVGDISKEEMLRSVSRTLGSLPARDDTKMLFAKPKPIKVSAPSGFRRIEFVGEQNTALVIGTWPVQAPLNLRDRIALQIVSRILQDRVRMRLRSDLGLSYSPGADFEPFNGFGDFALVQAYVQCDPSDSTKIASLVDDIGSTLAKDGIPEGEFHGARHLLNGQVRESFRNGSFLLGAVKRAQEKAESVTDAIALKDGLTNEITLDEVNTWAKKILVPQNCRTAAIVPKPFIGIFQPAQ